MLDRPANDWASWRESSPFATDPSLKIVATVAPPDQDTRRIGVEMILLHELGHVIGLATGMHPLPLIPPETQSGDYPFFALSWKLDQDKPVSLFVDAMPDRARIHYYATRDNALPLVRAKELYAGLVNTNLPTLYGAMSPLEDFAESFSTYVHTQILKRPWQVQVLLDNQPIATYHACWDEPRCAAKRALLEKLLAPPP